MKSVTCKVRVRSQFTVRPSVKFYFNPFPGLTRKLIIIFLILKYNVLFTLVECKRAKNYLNKLLYLLTNREQVTRNSERAASTSEDSTSSISPMRANDNDETDDVEALLKAEIQ